MGGLPVDIMGPGLNCITARRLGRAGPGRQLAAASGRYVAKENNTIPIYTVLIKLLA